jgi:hypothetical protein
MIREIRRVLKEAVVESTTPGKERDSSFPIIIWPGYISPHRRSWFWFQRRRRIRRASFATSTALRFPLYPPSRLS